MFAHIFSISFFVNHLLPCPLLVVSFLIYPEKSIMSVQTRFRLTSVPPGLGQCGTLKPGLILFTAWLYSNEPDLRDTLQPDVLWWCHYPLPCPIQLGGFNWESILTVSVHPRRKIMSSFTQPHVDPNHYEFFFDECPCWSWILTVHILDVSLSSDNNFRYLSHYKWADQLNRVIKETYKLCRVGGTPGPGLGTSLKLTINNG